MLKALFVTRIHVKPTGDNRWFVQRETPLESFIDDWYRYGLKTAWHNLKWILQEGKAE